MAGIIFSSGSAGFYFGKVSAKLWGVDTLFVLARFPTRRAKSTIKSKNLYKLFKYCKICLRYEETKIFEIRCGRKFCITKTGQLLSSLKEHRQYCPQITPCLCAVKSKRRFNLIDCTVEICVVLLMPDGLYAVCRLEPSVTRRDLDVLSVFIAPVRLGQVPKVTSGYLKIILCVCVE